MTGLQFLFSAALWALPLAGLPILLHLLFRRKSKVVQFSTLRFIKSSLQRTAARRRINRWLLLSCRILLLALLIWAVAQPAKRLTAGWAGSNSMVAAIVIDDSYSMQLQQQQSTLLNNAQTAVQQLLSQDLADSQVAIFTSKPSNPPERFQSASAIQAAWRPLKPQPALVPLIDRIDAAADTLKHQTADHKWLIVLSDMQRREFPRAFPDFPEGQTVLIDLHPSDRPPTVITGVSSDPPQPRLGIGGAISVELAGSAQDSRALNLAISSADGPDKPLAHPDLPMAHLDADGRASVRIPYSFSTPSWLLLTASLQTPDALTWASSRSQLVKVPAPQSARVLNLGPINQQADGILRLALDPSQGANPAWPITLKSGSDFQDDQDLLAAILTQWPDEQTALHLAQFASHGGTLLLFIKPGLEETWPDLPDSEKSELLHLLPSAPISIADAGPFQISIARPSDPLLSDVGPVQSASGQINVQRMVAFDSSNPASQMILGAAPANPRLGSRLRGLLFRRALGAGQVYVWATLPIPQYGNLATSEIFLPMVVNCAMRPESEVTALNVEVGDRITLSNPAIPSDAALDLTTPAGPTYQVAPTHDSSGAHYISQPTEDPGLYIWKRGNQTIAYTNVQYPPAEAQLEYRSATEIAPPGPNTMVVRSLTELESRLQQAIEPQPRWSLPIAIVLFLLCLEALVGSLSRIRRPSTSAANTPVLAT